MFNDRLRTARMFRGFTQQQVADHIDMALRNYQKYESGEVNPVYDNLIRIADMLDISTDFLLGRDEYLKSLGVVVDVPRTNPPKRPNYRKSR